MSIEQQFLAAKVAHLDLSEYAQVESGTPVREAIARMRAERRNCAFVTKAGQLVGIFTDRDVLRRVVDQPATWDQPIEAVMTPNPRTVQGAQSAADALQLMDELHFRNVPALNDEGEICGNLTHFALIRYLADLYPEEVYNLPPTPDHFGDRRHGG